MAELLRIAVTARRSAAGMSSHQAGLGMLPPPFGRKLEQMFEYQTEIYGIFTWLRGIGGPREPAPLRGAPYPALAPPSPENWGRGPAILRERGQRSRSSAWAAGEGTGGREGPVSGPHPAPGRPEPGPSAGPGQSSGQVRPWSSCTGEGRPGRARTPPTSFPGAAAGRAAALPADGPCMGPGLVNAGGAQSSPLAAPAGAAGHGSHTRTLCSAADQRP